MLQPKYIANLLKSAAVRKREQERRIERGVQKERENEGDQFADKESFVTAAYLSIFLRFVKFEQCLYLVHSYVIHPDHIACFFPGNDL